VQVPITRREGLIHGNDTSEDRFGRSAILVQASRLGAVENFLNTIGELHGWARCGFWINLFRAARSGAESRQSKIRAATGQTI